MYPMVQRLKVALVNFGLSEVTKSTVQIADIPPVDIFQLKSNFNFRLKNNLQIFFSIANIFKQVEVNYFFDTFYYITY